MATYYKYVERGSDSYINWADIGKNLTETFQKQRADIDAKRDAFDKANSEATNMLSAPPQGDSKTLNEYALEHSANSQNAMITLNNMLRKGEIDYSKWSMMKQNLLDGTKQAFDVVKGYQDVFTKKWERMQSGKSSALEQELMRQAEEYSDFNKTQLYINPTDYRVSVAMKDLKKVDGKDVYTMSSNPNNFTTITSLAARMKGDYDKYDLNTNMDSYVKGLGAEIRTVQKVANAVGKTGLISDVLDITKRTNLPADAQGIITTFEQAETKMLESQIANPFSAASVLTDYKNMAPNGKPYRFTWDESDANSNPEAILLRNNGNGMPEVKLNDAQHKDALDYLRMQARMRYDYKEESKVTPALPDIDDERKKTNISLMNANETARHNKATEDIARTQAETANANAQAKLLKEQRKAKKDDEGEAGTGTYGERGAWNSWVNQNINITSDSPKKTVAGIKDALTKIGATDIGITGDWSGFGDDYVTIQIPGMEPKEINIDDDEDVLQVQKYIQENYPIGQIKKLKLPKAKRAPGSADEKP